MAIRGPVAGAFAVGASTIVCAGDTSRARSRPAIAGSAAISSRACASSMRAGNTPPRIAPASRMWRTSARVSTSVMAGMPSSVSQLEPAGLGARGVGAVDGGAHDRRACVHAV